MLSLLNASLLGGLFVVVVPTIIHLLSRRRARRVRFAPMELLLKSQKRTARSIRLRQLLLLLLRTLFFAAIAAALLRPLWLEDQAAVQSSAPVAVVVVLDASASMNAELDGKSAFVRAKDKAKDAVAGLVDDVRVGFVVCEARPREVVLPTFERTAVLTAIEQADVGFAYADVGACVARAAALANAVVDQAGKPLTGERRVVVVSDLAAHGFPVGGDVDGAAGEGVRVDLIAAFDEAAPPNHGIVDVASGFAAQGLQVRFHAARYGGPDVEVPADLFSDGTRASRLALPFSTGKLLDRVFTAAAASAPTTTTTTPTTPPEGHTLSVALGDDANAIDNQVVLPVEERAAVRVLLVDGEPDALPLADELFYAQQALSSSRVGTGGKSRLVLTTTTADRVDAAAFVDVDVVVLANVARLDTAAAAALVSHVEAGAGLFIAMGDQVDVDAWNRDLRALLPAVLRGVKGQALLDDASLAEVLGLTGLQGDHPVLRALAGVDAGTLAGLARVRTTTTMLVEPDSSPDRQTLARFTNDAPALLERAVGPKGEGRVMMLTTTIDREWTDLPIRPGFLPLLEQVVLYLGRALDDGRPRVLRVGEDRAVLAQSADVVVVDPAGIETRLEVKDGAAHLAPTRPGLHKVYVDNNGERALLSAERFTAMIDPREIDSTRVSDDEAKAAAPKGAVVRRGGDDQPGTPLWPPLLLLGVVLLLAEGALLRRSGSA